MVRVLWIHSDLNLEETLAGLKKKSVTSYDDVS